MMRKGTAPADGRRHLFSGQRLAALMIGVASALLLATGARAQEPLDLRIYRFWRAPDLTLVEVFGVVPFQSLTFVRQGEMERAPYRGTLEVHDSTGLVLAKREWQNTAQVPALTFETRARAATSEHFTFQLKPGRYTFLLEVTDSAAGTVRRVRKEISAPASAPEHSDLVLASAIERLASDTAAAPGALRRSGLAVVPNYAGAVTPERPQIGLFAELYRTSTAAESASVKILLEGTARRFHHETAPQPRIYPPGGGLETVATNLTGLPPGEYTIELEVAFARDTVRLTHGLRMLPPGAGEMAIAAELPYQDLNEQALDSIFEPMRYIATPNEQRAYESLSNATAKRRFLGRFWQQRASELGVSADSLRREFEERVTYADQRFRPPRPGQRGRMGWQTDRGRIYITYGPPAETYVETERKDQMNPWAVWKYITGRGDKYVFWDRSGFGDFELVFSTNRDEPGQVGWERLFTTEARQFIAQF